MFREETSKVVARLPWRLGQRVDGYLDAVEASLDEIARDLKISTERIDKKKLFYLLMIKSIYDIINGQYWIMYDILSISKARDVAGFRIGAETITETSGEYSDAQVLRLEIEEILNANSLNAIVREPLGEIVRNCVMR